ncbi:MAG: methyltransferase [Actinomycetota bacterium]|nr:methyltransferase [Actinomycetota bacterium]
MGEHYFSADPGSDEIRQPVKVSVWGHQLALMSASGVFARGRLDRGTAVLLRETGPPVSTGTLLDLGCGYGVIACALATAQPTATVWAVDVNERALRLCADNATSLRLGDRVRPALPDDVPAGLQFDEIWSNPPIRIGKQALHALLLTWLPRLAPSGRAVLVVGKNLGADSLQRWICDEGYGCERLASAKGFRILEVRR